MGKLVKSPKAPSLPVQQVVAAAEPVPTGPTEEEKAAARAEEILRRSRSRLGTVLTGFQGVLQQGEIMAPRKTLLGE